MHPPPTRTGDESDEYFGTVVPDPYRWLEDGAEPEVRAWLREQGDTTRAYLDGLPGRALITAALDRAVRRPRSGQPVHRGASWFRTANDGRQQQDVLVVSAEPFGPATVLIDPNRETADANTALGPVQPSPDGRLVAYSLMGAGSDWRTWRVRDVESGVDRPDVVEWSKFTRPEWLPDGSGFVYGGFDPPATDEFTSANRAMRIALHRLGTPQSADETLLETPDEPDLTFEPLITEDGRWLVLLGSRGTEQSARVWVRDLDAPAAGVRPLVTEAVASWHLLGSVGDELVMITDLDAPRSRLVALHAGTGAVRELVAERPDSLESGVLAGGRLVLHWLRDASSRLTRHELDGTELDAVRLPGLGSVVALEGRAEDAVLHIGWTSFATPESVLRYDVATGEVVTAFETELPSSLVTEQLWVTSADGTRVPVFVLRHPDVTPANGPHPTWLYGYGGFRVPTTPSFEPTRFAFAEAGGVVAVACLRGGGEYGAAWHDAGRRAHKQNVFDDAIATAEHLIASGWTTPSRLALTGRSNGGLLAGAVLTQRPELFAAVVPEVGVLDLLRFPRWTIGWAWISDYGDPRADAEQFRTLLAYSPLHNVRAGVDYPPVLILTSDHDDRVVPAHSLKFAAALQAASRAPAFLRVEPAGGHKEGRSHDALVAERTDVLAFLSEHTGLRWA